MWFFFKVRKQFLKLGLRWLYNSVTTIRTSKSLKGDYKISIKLFHKVTNPQLAQHNFMYLPDYIKVLAQMPIGSFLS